MIPCPSFKIPKGNSLEQYLINHIAEGDTDIRIDKITTELVEEQQ